MNQMQTAKTTNYQTTKKADASKNVGETERIASGVGGGSYTQNDKIRKRFA